MLSGMREVVYGDVLPRQGLFFLAGDIGGTNSNFGILETSGKPRLVVSFHVKSQLITDYTQLTQELCAYIKNTYDIIIQDACFGAAGIVSENRHYVKPTNLAVVLDAHAIKKAAGLRTFLLINDFEAVALGLDFIAPGAIIVVNRGKPRGHAHKACIGAGTGLGKVALFWNNAAKCYVPVASEGGHADCAGQTADDVEFFNFSKSIRNTESPVSWEDVLSGNGIAALYQFLGTQKNYPETEISKEIAHNRFEPDKISLYSKEDLRCKDTFLLYARFYARCAKNFALETLALNGLYIAGGIAAKNISIFHNPLFMEEFKKCGKYGTLLSEVPVYVIADYDISLYGAYEFMRLHNLGIL